LDDTCRIPPLSHENESLNFAFQVPDEILSIVIKTHAKGESHSP